MVLHSAISYTQMIVLLLLVADHEPLSPWRFIGILLVIAAIMVASAMAFGEAERSRVRAHKLQG